MKILKYIVLLSCLASCVTEYDFTQNVASDVLVVEAFICDQPGESKVLLTQSVPFNDAYYIVYADSAEVKVIEKSGTENDFEFRESAYLPVDENFTGSFNTEYRLHIKWRGESYESDWTKMQRTSEIASVNWSTGDKYVPAMGTHRSLNFSVTTHPSESTSRQNRYLFEETWINIAPLSFNKKYKTYFIYNNLAEPLDLEYKIDYFDNITYCWPTTHPTDIYLSSSDGISENVIIDAPTYELNITGQGYKLLNKYSILVKQYGISENVYHTLSLIKMFSEDKATLFSVQPGFVKGNVNCVSNPKKRTVGVFYASEVKTQRIFIQFRDFSIEDRLLISSFSKGCEPKDINLPFTYCPGQKEIVEINDMLKAGYEIQNIFEDTEIQAWIYTFATTPCIDCRTQGNNVKPSWWGELTE